jgi:sodium-independent sulfate anion transporter 11
MLTQDFSKRGQALFFFNLKPSVVAVFEGVQPKGFITFYHRHDLDHLFQRWKSVFSLISYTSE